MKVTVIKEFVDKYTGELREIGSSFSCDIRRFEEIKNAGDYVEELPEARREKNNHGNNRKKI